MQGRLWPITQWEVGQLMADLRISDVMEARTCAMITGRMVPGWSIEGDVREAVATAQCWGMFADVELVAICGITPHEIRPDVGAVWLLGTSLADRLPVLLTKLSRAFLDAFSAEFSFIGNVVPEGMDERLRWLRVLGFDRLQEQAQFSHMGLVAFGQHPRHGPEG